MAVPNPSDRLAAGLSSGDVSVARARASPNRFIRTHHPDHTGYPTAESFAAKQQPRMGSQPCSHTSSLQTLGVDGDRAMSRRQTNPVCPIYQLPSPGEQPLLASCDTATRRPVSRSLDTSDIPGAQAVPVRFGSANRRMHQNIDYSDVKGTQSRVAPRAKQETYGLSTIGIEGSTPMSRTWRLVASPGMGTLYNKDISGALPGQNSGHEGLPTSWGMGRFPLPSVQQAMFGYGARQTVLQRPTGYEMFDRKSRWHL